MTMIKKMNHNDYIAKLRTYSTDSVRYVRDDAKRAAEAADEIGSPNSGYYWDEYHYACMELRKRADGGAR